MISATIRLATVKDAEALADFGRATFIETFVEQFPMNYPPDDLEAFLAQAHSREAFARKLAQPTVAGWIAENGARIAGYATAGPCALPHPDVRNGDGELYRLYIAREAQGDGLGSRLLQTALGWLEQTRPRTLWIGVWSGNLKAQRLYAGHGFTKAGEYAFAVGHTRDLEFILRRGRRERC